MRFVNPGRLTSLTGLLLRSSLEMFGTHCNVAAANVFVSQMVLWTGCGSWTPLTVLTENGVRSGEGAKSGYREKTCLHVGHCSPVSFHCSWGLLECQIPGIPEPQFLCSLVHLRNHLKWFPSPIRWSLLSYELCLPHTIFVFFLDESSSVCAPQLWGLALLHLRIPGSPQSSSYGLVPHTPLLVAVF